MRASPFAIQNQNQAARQMGGVQHTCGSTILNFFGEGHGPFKVTHQDLFSFIHINTLYQIPLGYENS